MGGCRCTYRECTTNTSCKLHFYHYPVADKERCYRWMLNARKLDYLKLQVNQLKNRVVCELHFRPEMFMNCRKNRLIKTAVPTEDGPSPPEDKKTTEEYEKYNNVEFDVCGNILKKDTREESLTEVNVNKSDTVFHVNASPVIGYTYIRPVETQKKCKTVNEYLEIDFSLDDKSCDESKSKVDDIDKISQNRLGEISKMESFIKCKKIMKNSKLKSKDVQMKDFNIEITVTEKTEDSENQVIPSKNVVVKTEDTIDENYNLMIQSKNNENKAGNYANKEINVRSHKREQPLSMVKKIQVISNIPVSPATFSKPIQSGNESIKSNILGFLDFRRKYKNMPVPTRNENIMAENKQISHSGCGDGKKVQFEKLLNPLIKNRIQSTNNQVQSLIQSADRDSIKLNSNVDNKNIDVMNLPIEFADQNLEEQIDNIIEVKDKLPKKTEETVHTTEIFPVSNAPANNGILSVVSPSANDINSQLLQKVEQNSREISDLKSIIMNNQRLSNKSQKSKTVKSVKLKKIQLYRQITRYLSPKLSMKVYNEMFCSFKTKR